jgi:hypothetical protein
MCQLVNYFIPPPPPHTHTLTLLSLHVSCLSLELNGQIASAESERKNLVWKMGFKDSLPELSSSDATCPFMEGISVYRLDVKGMVISHTAP